jgi:hypothetical protein
MADFDLSGGLLNLFGGGGGGVYDDLLTEEQKKRISQGSLASIASALLKAGGPSTQRVGFGQALGSALEAGAGAAERGQMNAVQQILMRQKIDEAKRLGQYQAALTGTPQAAEPAQAQEPLTQAQASLLSQTAPTSVAGRIGPSPERAQFMDQVQAQSTIAPAPLTATERRYNELMRKADVANQFGKFDDADKLMGQALKIKPPEKYATTPQYGNSKQGTPISFVLSESGGMKLLDVERSPEFNYQDTGSYISVRDKNSNKELERIAKTMSPGEVASNIIAQGNLGVAQGNLGVAKANLGVAQGGLNLRQQEFARGGYQLKEGPDGLSYVPTAPGGPAIPVMTAAGTPFEGAGAKPTEDQSKSAGFAFRMKQSTNIFNQPATDKSGNPIIDPNTNKPVSLEELYGKPGKYQAVMRSIPSAGLTTGIANISEDVGRQQYRQAQENWVTANLRPESGAVIGADEMEKEIGKYFPQTNDKPQTIEQKQRARRDTELAMTVRAGPAYKQVEKAVAAQSAAMAAPTPTRGVARLIKDPVTGIYRYVTE